MSDKDKYSFIVVKYPQKETADAALKAVLGLAKEKVVKLRDAATITKTEKDKIKLHQTKDDSTSKGLLKGGVIGVIFAVLFGPAGWIVAGAAAGGALATFDRGIKNKLLTRRHAAEDAGASYHEDAIVHRCLPACASAALFHSLETEWCTLATCPRAIRRGSPPSILGAVSSSRR